MGKRNGYFQLIIKEQGTFLRIYPPVEGGEKVTTSEAAAYLTREKLTAFDVRALNEVIVKQQDAPVELLVSSEAIIPATEILAVTISEDKMTVKGRFYPPSTEGRMLDKREIISDMAMAGIKAGVDEAVIEEFLANRKYCTDYILAKGFQPVQGKDAVITYHFNTEINLRPTVHEDGTVDYHELNNIARVNEGQVIATLTKADPGHAGLNVCGEVIRPREVKKLHLSPGKNMVLSEDRLQLISQVNGHASLVGDMVFVSNIYEVQDVDASTGDITYDGNVLVKGNVRSGYAVNAKGNIEVNGVVEGAVLKAEGDVLLKRGIQGMGKAKIECAGNLIAKFIENAQISAGGFIQTESIMHSHVMAKEEIQVSGKKGFITGGTVRSSKMIAAKNLGSPMGTDTILEVGVDPILKEKYQTMQMEIKESEKVLATTKPVFTAFIKKLSSGEKFSKEQAAKVQELQKTITANEQRISNNVKEMEGIEDILQAETNACIKAQGNVYTGVKIVISDCTLFVRENLTFCRFVREKGEIKGYTL
ncbi:MAG: FapA family protein [Lachnospiraceae bacterium]|nr:FapA family protein [Lachnospiraceae bacterium]